MKYIKINTILILLIITVLVISGCNVQPPVESNVEPPALTYHKVDLDYFNARRYTATITENRECIFWADNEGLHQYNKNTEETALLFSGENIDFLSVYDDTLYCVVDEEKLYRIDTATNDIELIYELDESYMAQIQDYTVVDGKLFFLNTHSLFYYDISSRSVKDLKEVTVETLQIKGDDIYFIDHGERTNTIYIYSLKNNSCKVFLGDGEYTPMEKAYMNFRISNGVVYYTQAMPSGTYKASMNGEGKIIRDSRVTFICDSSVSNGIYYMSYGLERSYLYFCDEDGQESFVCQMKELNINSGVAVVDGYVYYNSGFERLLDQDSGYYINDYINAKPTATKLLSDKTADDSLS